MITGITGQDGSYLAELLLAKGYEVAGVVRRTSHHSYERVEHLLPRIGWFMPTCSTSIRSRWRCRRPSPTRSTTSRAQSYVPTSFSQPVLTGEFTALGVTRILEAIRLARRGPRSTRPAPPRCSARCASPPDRVTPYHPRSPYGVAKVYGHWITVNYRESYGLYAVSGILFNHESPGAGSSS
jgi:GDPmannose 4,6-dehydratase